MIAARLGAHPMPEHATAGLDLPPGRSVLFLEQAVDEVVVGLCTAAGADAERPAARAHSRRTAKAGRGHGMRGSALLEKIDGKGAKAASKPAKPAGGHSKADDDFIDSLLKK